MPIAHCISSPEGVIVEADRGFADLLKRPISDLPGLSYRAITHPADLAISSKMLASLIDRAPPIQLRKRYLRPDGSVIEATLFVTYFSNPHRLVSTIFWNEDGLSRHPKRLWEAALRIRHMDSVRKAAFGERLTFDPVISLLTTIYLAEAEGRIVGIEHVAKDVGLAVSTTRRWIKALRQQALILGDDAASDIQLSQSGIMGMERILDSVFQTPTTPSDLA